MPPFHVGNTTSYERQPTGTLKLFADGSVEAVETYKGVYSLRLANLPIPLASHPDFPSLKLYEFAGSKEEGEIYKYENIYKGVYAGINLLDLMQTDVQVMTSNEPVETFWKFSYPVGSPPTPPVTNVLLAQVQAALDANLPDITAISAGAWPKTTNGVDTKPYDGAPNWVAITSGSPAYELWNLRRRGIDSYRMMNLTARLSYVQPTTTPPTAEFAIQVGTVPASNTTALQKAITLGYVPTPSVRNFLFNGLNWKVAGGAITITEEHQMSGPNKWQPYLYAVNTQ
jgi:hypothetical protein